MELVIDQISKSYGQQWVLDSVSFTMGEGEIVALVGPNGSGQVDTDKNYRHHP